MRNIKIVFRSLHIVWALIGVFTTVVLAMTGGHPPGIVFVPVALLTWGAGHFFIWLSRKLTILGILSSENRNNNERKLPLTLVIILFLFGAISFSGLIIIILTIIDQYSKQSELLIVLAIWVPTSICFVGILLRQAWSRILASGMFVTVGFIYLYDMAESIVYAKKNSSSDWIVGVLIMMLFLFLAQHLLRSSRIKGFYSK